ncbi:signal recognition particle receptor subunit beta-like [Varroa jacobsoni]|uniref:Signal recognition particle receptor subunit beta n=1 Tax=Varroa destructor TaxID=109461 RepID=A0A7M7K975_VARDE|nr:signal recognition particle receptor subunit beta-like [Varroa destructor]XP_022687226.1 signal recognition particle receptor subunit beta-like [Varroa jacobsoni]
MDPTTLLAVVVTVIVVVATVFILVRGSSKARNNVLICGISNAGKTVLYAQLCSGKPIQTYVSIKENQGSCEVAGGKRVRVVDIPGNERQRVNIFDNYKTTARGIVFVVDSISFMKELKDVAEYAYIVLSDPDTCHRRLRVLFACNKHDEAMAKSSQVIKTNLEKELTLLRKTQTSKLVTTENVQMGRTLGKEHKDVKFEDLPHKIDFVEFSALENFEPVKEWLSTI